MINVIEHKFNNKKKELHNTKFEFLIMEKTRAHNVSNNKSINFEEWKNNLVNNSKDKDFSEKEFHVLKLGLKMSFVAAKFPLEDFVVAIGSGIKIIDFHNQDITRRDYFQIMKRNLTNHTLKVKNSHLRTI